MGAFFYRYKWKKFRKKFDNLRLCPLLDYRRYRSLDGSGLFRFMGEIESLTDGHTLWVKGKDLTIPVSLKKTKCFLLPANDGEEIPSAPEQIRWNRFSTLTEGVKVFIGGRIENQNNRLNFVSSKETPLMVVFYNCPDTELTDAITRSARTHNEYWNSFTPVSLVIGALALIYIAVSLLNRPAYRLTVITALVAVFVPILPAIPPGLLFTTVYRRLTWHARKLRAYWDLVRLPLTYLQDGKQSADLHTGEKYGFIKTDSLVATEIPFIIPEDKDDKTRELYVFGILPNAEQENDLPKRSSDPFVSFCALSEEPAILAHRYAIKAYTMEALAWVVLLMGVGVNLVFIMLIISLLGGN